MIIALFKFSSALMQLVFMLFAPFLLAVFFLYYLELDSGPLYEYGVMVHGVYIEFFNALKEVF